MKLDQTMFLNKNVTIALNVEHTDHPIYSQLKAESQYTIRAFDDYGVYATVREQALFLPWGIVGPIAFSEGTLSQRNVA